MSFTVGTMRLKRAPAEQLHVLGGHGGRDRLLDREAEVRPRLLPVEAVAHVVAGFHHELLALAPLGGSELGIQVAQREAPVSDVARLVHHLSGGIELGIEVGRGLRDASRRHQRTLLAVHELRQRLRLLMPAHRDVLLLVELVPQRGPVDRDKAVGDLLRVLGIEVERPVDAGGGIPLRSKAQTAPAWGACHAIVLGHPPPWSGWSSSATTSSSIASPSRCPMGAPSCASRPWS
jgi:hypothetical protein